MTIRYDRDVFFAGVRGPVFHGMEQGQVDGCNAILDEAEARGIGPKQLAYVLATPWWETMQTMQPIRELGRGRGRPYGRPDAKTGQTYFGRGFVQLTWEDNYARFGAILGIDLLHNPDLALELPIATKILFEGMTRGLFTGRKLSDYINDHEVDFVGARRIINGLDHATTIAGAANKFAAALHAI